MCLFRFYLFLHVYELTVVVVELILQESEFLRGYHMDAKSIFHLPLALQAENALVDVGSHVRMYVQVEPADSDLIDEVVNFILQRIGEEDA